MNLLVWFLPWCQPCEDEMGLLFYRLTGDFNWTSEQLNDRSIVQIFQKKKRTKNSWNFSWLHIEIPSELFTEMSFCINLRWASACINKSPFLNWGWQDLRVFRGFPFSWIVAHSLLMAPLFDLQPQSSWDDAFRDQNVISAPGSLKDLGWVCQDS